MTEPQDRPSTYPWPPLLLLAVAGVAFAWERWFGASAKWADHWRIDLIGWAMLALGMGLFISASRAFARHNTTIRPDRGASHLMSDGPYAWSRNPIYLADTLLLAGAGLAGGWPSLLVGAVVFVVLVDRLAIRPEEAHLERQFGQAFTDYKARVRRWL